MTSQILALLVLLLAPAPESESVRLRRLFEEHWATRLRESPEMATYPRGASPGRKEWSDEQGIRTGREVWTARSESNLVTARRLTPMEGSRRFGDAPRGVSTLGGTRCGMDAVHDSQPFLSGGLQDFDADLTSGLSPGGR